MLLNLGSHSLFTTLSGSIQHISSDPMKVVNVAVEESTDWGKLLLAFVSSLVAPEEEEIEGIFHKLSLELP